MDCQQDGMLYTFLSFYFISEDGWIVLVDNWVAHQVSRIKQCTLKRRDYEYQYFRIVMITLFNSQNTTIKMQKLLIESNGIHTAPLFLHYWNQIFFAECLFNLWIDSWRTLNEESPRLHNRGKILQNENVTEDAD